MMIPTIHMNGTSQKELLQQVCDAMEACRLAVEALAKAAPNGRDYYTQGVAVIEWARDEHFARMAKVESVRKELQEMAIAIDQQEGGRT